MRTLLARLTQYRRSGRVSTATMLSSVGGTGSAAGSLVMRSPHLNTLTSATYNGRKKTAATSVATIGRAGPPPRHARRLPLPPSRATGGAGLSAVDGAAPAPASAGRVAIPSGPITAPPPGVAAA